MPSDDTDTDLNLTEEEMISMAMGQTVEREIAGQTEEISIASDRFRLTAIQARLIGEALSQFKPASAVESEVAHRTQSKLLQKFEE